MVRNQRGLVAQRLEQWTHNPLVRGSNPFRPIQDRKMKSVEHLQEFFSKLSLKEQLIVLQSISILYPEDLENISIFFNSPIEEIEKLQSKVQQFVKEFLSGEE